MSRLRAAEAKVSTVERRLAATQDQLRDAESRLEQQRSKYGVAEGKWEARVRELEQRVRAAEEKVKRERQGAKERVAELEQDARWVKSGLSLECRLRSVADSSACAGGYGTISPTPSGGISSSTRCSSTASGRALRRGPISYGARLSLSYFDSRGRCRGWPRYSALPFSQQSPSFFASSLVVTLLVAPRSPGFRLENIAR